MEKVKVTSEYLRAQFGHGIDYGYTAIPNLLLVHGIKIGLDDHVIFFIIQILRATYQSKDGIIKDTDLNMDATRKTFQRIRKHLSELKDGNGKNLVFIKTFYAANEEGKISGYGTSYDFRLLFDYLITIEEGLKKKPAKRKKAKGKNVPSVPKNDKPKGQNSQAGDKKGSKKGSVGKNVPPAPKNVPYSSEVKKKTHRGVAKLLFISEGWEFYSDETARYKDDPEFIPWSRLPRSFDKAITMKMDKFRVTGSIK